MNSEERKQNKLKGEDLKNKARLAIIEFLSWNDKNGTYRDSDNEDNPMSLSQLVSCLINQDVVDLPECEIGKDDDDYDIYVNGYWVTSINKKSHPELFEDLLQRELDD